MPKYVETSLNLYFIKINWCLSISFHSLLLLLLFTRANIFAFIFFFEQILVLSTYLCRPFCKTYRPYKLATTKLKFISPMSVLKWNNWIYLICAWNFFYFFFQFIESHCFHILYYKHNKNMLLRVCVCMLDAALWQYFSMHCLLAVKCLISGRRNYCADLSGQQPLLQISWLSDVQQQQQSEQVPLLSVLQLQLSHLRSMQQSDAVHLQSALFLNVFI